MPIGDFESLVLRVLAAHRHPDSFVGGATVLHATADSWRYSQDFDVFHDAEEALTAAFGTDSAALRSAGFDVAPSGPVGPTFRRAIVSRGDARTKVEWVLDSAFRFFPVEPDLALGWRLSFWDAATNKVLAMAGRHKVRDLLDCLYLHQHHLHLGALVWAAAGKDPGLSPEFVLDWAVRGSAFRVEDLAEVRLGRPMDIGDIKTAWRTAVAQARALVDRLPPDEIGCLYLDERGAPVAPDPTAASFAKLRRHFGRLGGAVARVAE
ncbi:MAG: hypothetical protein FJ100_20210 [Deltaproteobacteria bacterium]|nr:hypothetical protein [Deltaproteobacteria bacterium]